MLKVATEPMHAAWALLARSAYSAFDRAQGNGFWGTTKSVIEKRPSLDAGEFSSGASRLPLHFISCQSFSKFDSPSSRYIF